MILSICFAGVFFFLSNDINAQNNQGIETAAMPEHQRYALVIEIDARVLNEDQDIIWNEIQRKIGMPGIPVGIRLVGTNLMVAVQFTPIIRQGGNVLVALVQIWIDTQGNGVSYHVSQQTIPIDFDEPFYFFPLGTSNPSIELLMTVNPYSEISQQEQPPDPAASSNR